MRWPSATTRAAFARLAMSGLCAAALGMQVACYSYAPLQTAAPAQPKEMGVVLNDRGRTLLADRVGALVDRIDGRIVSIDSQNIVMNVARVTDVRGTASTWTGEQVTIPRDGVLGFRERKLSKLKILVLVGVAALAIATVLRTSLDLFGDAGKDPVPPPPQSS